MAGVASLTDQDEDCAVELLGFGLSSRTGFGVAGFDGVAFTLETGAVAIIGHQGLALREQEVTGEAVLHFHFFADTTEVLDALKDTDVPVPRTLLLCEDPEIIGTSFCARAPPL